MDQGVDDEDDDNDEVLSPGTPVVSGVSRARQAGCATTNGKSARRGR